AYRIIAEKIFDSEEYKRSDKIFIYVSMKYEVSTTDIINKALSDGKTVAIPISLPNREMFFVQINGLENLVKSHFGVYEPVCVRSDEIKPDENTLLVVPGVAFDKEGRRMGYGGGYYDTYIEKYNIENTVALAFDIQVKDSIPYEKHDKKMKIIITEKTDRRNSG
ncbi:MAG: 5-formyltetrahydrofolate cyclo-ligase, partial [Clostridiales bacterium]|nr:5-formyltetrahydrofolate cyclo-ligase [Clostridiales bacterium]